MAMLITMNKGNYTNGDAVENVVRYVTRTRLREERAAELITWGGWGVGVYQTPELVIEQFCRLQKIHRIETRGSRIFHEVLGITKEEFDKLGCDYGRIYQVAVECAKYYYSMGYQVVFAIHNAKDGCLERNKGLHIHFVVNTINFMTGNKWHSNLRENWARNRIFDDIMRRFMDPEPFESELPF